MKCRILGFFEVGLILVKNFIIKSNEVIVGWNRGIGVNNFWGFMFNRL